MDSMPNQELLDYINQARSAGQTDEQIKQALRNSGWGEAEINEAFGSSGFHPIQTAPVNSQAAATGLPWKIIIPAAAGILIIGGGAYFIFGRGGEENSTNQVLTEEMSKKQETQKSEKPDIVCESLIPAADFKRIMGQDISDFSVKKEQVAIPDLGGSETCSYVYQQMNERGIFPVNEIRITLKVIWRASSRQAGDAQFYYQEQKKAYDLIAQTEKWTVKDLPEFESGFSAETKGARPSIYSQGNQASQGDVVAITSNKKYVMEVTVQDDSGKSDVLTMAKELTKVFDKSLDKY